MIHTVRSYVFLKSIITIQELLHRKKKYRVESETRESYIQAEDVDSGYLTNYRGFPRLKKGSQDVGLSALTPRKSLGN